MWGILSCWRRVKAAFLRALARRAYGVGVYLADAARAADLAARAADKHCADR